MITQVSGLDVRGVSKDPRRKAQSIQFRHRSNIPYQKSYEEAFARQQKNALWTSISIVAGSILFTSLYFMISAFQKSKNLI